MGKTWFTRCEFKRANELFHDPFGEQVDPCNLLNVCGAVA